MSIELIVFIVYCISIFGAWLFISIQKRSGNDIDNFGALILMFFPLTNMILTAVIILYLIVVELICIRILRMDKWTWNKFWNL